MIETIIKEKSDCTGCHACANVCPVKCISMVSDEEGFLYPKTDYSQCTKCGQCIAVCPITKKIVIDNEPKAFACISKNDRIRETSSSGGLFTLIAEQILNEGGIVFGASFNDDFEVEHVYVDTKKGIEQLRGSKYVQSKIGETYRQVKTFLESGRRVLFVGTPCQIGGLKSYLTKPYETLFCIDLICHGVPSPYLWRRYVKYQEQKKGAPVKYISFRDKKYGWRKYVISILFENGVEYNRNLYKDLFMRAFLKDISLRPSCYDCKYKTLHRQSDITLADFWGIEELLPEMDDNKGTSLVFTNSSIGRTMLEHINNQIICKEVDINKAIQYNPSAVKSVKQHPKRDDFFKEIELKPINKVISKYCIDKTHVRILRVIKRIMFKG